MITSALLSLLALPLGVSPAGSPAAFPALVATPTLRDTQDDDVEAAMRSAGADVAALLELASSYEQDARAADAKRVFERVVELDADNARARKGLRHERYDGRWFESYVELARYKREEAAAMLERGLVRWEDAWVPEADLPFLRMGWVRDAQQSWMHPTDIARALQVEEWTAAGYQFRADDSSWVSPEDFEHWSAVLWECGDEWLDTEAANSFHANPDTPWVLTGEHFRVLTTCEWNYGNSARWHADRAHEQLVRLFGMAPQARPSILVLNSLEQYNAAAAGPLIDSEGLSSLSGAYFADGALDTSVQPTRYRGIGVSYWQGNDPQVAGWGPLWVRWAAAQGFVEGIDPSWTATSARVVNSANNAGDLQAFGVQFWGEKRIPRWLRYGAAAYVERFLPNPESADTEGGADLWELRSFALRELEKSGGLRELPDVFRFTLSLEDIPGSIQRYLEAGLLVSFLLDGSQEDAELQGKLDALRATLPSGSSDEVRAAAAALEAALSERSETIRAYATL